MDVPAKPRVQFISKPMVAPFRDGSKCLVRDLCTHLEAFEPHVMSARGGCDQLGPTTVCHSVYSNQGGFSPGLLQNLQAFAWLSTKAKADLWHSVFAPNPRSSQMLALLRRFRRVPVVQTIASPPRSFENPHQLLFGDVVVAQSAWTLAQFRAAFAESSLSLPHLVEIPPPAPQVSLPSVDRCVKQRARLGLEMEDQVFLYPGDLEVSRGASTVAGWACEIRRRLPRAKIVIAYRDKTRHAKERADDLRAITDPSYVVIARNVDDILALVSLTTAVLFPVDDLYGKVDLPIVLLEALRLGTPVLARNEGPLQSLQGAILLDADDAAWLDWIENLAENSELKAQVIDRGHRAIVEHYEPARIAGAYEAIYQDLVRKPV